MSLTNNEIIKAKAHFEYGIKCDIFKEPVLSYTKTVLEAFDEINRQKAEIERLEEVQVNYVKAYFDEFVERLKNDISLAELDSGLLNEVIDELVETMKNEFSKVADFTDLIKAEAIKEFAKRVKLVICENTTPQFSIDGKPINVWSAKSGYDSIDNLVKEMVGDAE